MPPLPPSRPVPPPPLPSSPPVVGLDREASEEEVKDRDREEEKGDNKSKNSKTEVVDRGSSESVSSGANSDGPENGT